MSLSTYIVIFSFLFFSADSQEIDYKAGLIMPESVEGSFDENCCIYCTKKGFKVYDKPNGNQKGTIKRNTEYVNLQDYQYSLFFYSDIGNKKQKLDLNELAEVSYEVWSINYIDKIDGFLKIINSDLELWISEEDIRAQGFVLTSWQTFIIDHTDILLGFYAKEPGLNLMSEPNKNASILKFMQGDTYDIRPTKETKRNWVKVKVTKSIEHPCGSNLSNEENIEYHIEGWIEIVDSNGNPNVWYYSRGC